MTERVTLQPAYVLHTRPYRDTSLMVDMLTFRHGRICAVARGARQARSRLKAILRSFDSVLVSWRGRGDLVTLTQAEYAGALTDLRGQALVCGMYLNELLVRLLSRHDPCPEIFTHYQHTLLALAKGVEQRDLRCFELNVLAEVGYAVDASAEADTGEAIDPEQSYQWQPGRGFVAVPTQTTHGVVVMGRDVTAIAQQQWADAAQLNQCKRITRAALAHAMANRPIKSRELFGRWHHAQN
jgi:DNA repair protein RecO (recombination protein O)